MIGNQIIGIDARMIEMSGIGTYIQNIIVDPMYDYAIGESKIIHKYNPQIKIIENNMKVFSFKEQFLYPQKEINAAEIDIIHFPHFNIPLFYRGKFVVTIHDIIFLVYPKYMNIMKRILSTLLIGHAINKASLIYTVSDNSKQDLSKMFRTNTKKFFLTYNAIDKEKFSEGLTGNEIRKKYSIPKEKQVILFVGNLKPHKNLARLLQAFSTVNKRRDVILVLAGKNFSAFDICKQIELLDLKNSVVETGIVSKQELIGLYKTADLFVFPSVYEGFGIPPLEAMACGTPVVCSNSSAIPEVVGEAALTFNPFSIEEMVVAMEKMLSDKELREDYIKKGYTQVNKFSWISTRKVINDSISQQIINKSL